MSSPCAEARMHRMVSFGTSCTLILPIFRLDYVSLSLIFVFALLYFVDAILFLIEKYAGVLILRPFCKL